MDLNINISFEDCVQFFTARQVYFLINEKVPGLTIQMIGRFLNQHSKEKYYSREGVKYLCRVIT